MFARISTYHGAPDKVKEGSRVIGEVTPELQQMPGFHGGYLLVDGTSGKAISISLWGTEEEVIRSTPLGGPIRSRIAQALGAHDEPTVEILELGTETTYRVGGAGFARLVEHHGSPGKLDDAIRAAQAGEPSLKQMQGFKHAFVFVDRKSGKLITVTLWGSEDDRSRSSSAVSPIRESIVRSLGATGTPTVELYEVAGEVPERMRKAA